MKAYVISDVKVKDPAALGTYGTRAAAAIAKYGGHFLVVRGRIEKLEGDWSPEGSVVVEFADMERAKAWYHSAEYGLALEVRDKAMTRNMILAEGHE
jgi:uncharacterized protein (DUF1330 family)